VLARCLTLICLLCVALTSSAPGAATAPPSLAQMIGQRIMVGLPGRVASQALLGRIRAGEVGSVILFAANIGSPGQTRRLIDSLQEAARAGGNPPLLIATDQEGGQVKRLPTLPPRLSPPQLVATGDVRRALAEGLATGRALRGLGINMDLAPVVDVPLYRGSFIRLEGRAFSPHAGLVATFAAAFAGGLQAGGVAATAKHFPGVGAALTDTDYRREELRPTSAQLAAALLPYRRLIAGGLDAVMLSTAGFPAYDRTGTVAVLSAPIVQQLLREQLGFGGVTITDGLGSPTGHGERQAGVLAAEAGADILLYTDSAPGVYTALEQAAARGGLPGANLLASYERIVALKAQLTANSA
jgi:beta-N-acetylhexosaminidase